MNEIRVKLRVSSERGQLYPRYDDEADLLEVESRVPRRWPYGVDIDGRIIFDIDSEGILANFDVIIRKNLWKVAKADPCLRPLAFQRADLEFCRETLDQKSFHLPLEILTNQMKTCVLIRFGETRGAPEAIEISEKCIALVDVDRLVGFYIDLA